MNPFRGKCYILTEEYRQGLRFPVAKETEQICIHDHAVSSKLKRSKMTLKFHAFEATPRGQLDVQLQVFMSERETDEVYVHLTTSGELQLPLPFL